MKRFVTLVMLISAVSLLQLKAQQSPPELEIRNKKVNLKWEAYSEDNLNYYLIERSPNGKQFETIAMVKGSDRKSYQWYDKDAISQITYYRIKAVMYGGISNLLGSVIVFQLSEGMKEISVYPDLKSPFSIYTDLGSLNDESASVEITDSDGFVMLNGRLTEQPSSSFRVIMSQLIQKVNCSVSCYLSGRLFKSRLNIYDASLNFSDTNQAATRVQAFYLR